MELNTNTRRGFTQINGVGQAWADNAPAKRHSVCRLGVSPTFKHEVACIVGLTPDLQRRTSGFTLIELLIVALIIGVLAAVALPQYQLAVVKSKTSAYLPLMKNILQMEETYYLEHGNYIYDARKLDITMPSECTLLGYYTHNLWACGTDFFLDFGTDLSGLSLSYCPHYNKSYSDCRKNKHFTISVGYLNRPSPTEIIWKCGVENSSSLGTKICNSLNFD